ncbi:MAG: hypothetical protein AAF637_25825, partial [Pseudomonadota bacterium]
MLFDFTKGIVPAISAQKRTIQQHIPSNYNPYTTNNLLHLKATGNKLATKTYPLLVIDAQHRPLTLPKELPLRFQLKKERYNNTSLA